MMILMSSDQVAELFSLKIETEDLTQEIKNKLSFFKEVDSPEIQDLIKKTEQEVESLNKRLERINMMYDNFALKVEKCK